MDGKRIGHPAVRYLATFAATVAAVYLGLCFLPDDPYIRAQLMNDTIYDRAQWLHERLYFDKTPIDIAIVGTSRAGVGVNSPKLEQLLRAEGHNLHTASLFLPEEGYDIRLRLVKQLLEQKRPKLLLINVHDQLPRFGHPAFADLAEPLDVLSASMFINRKFHTDLVYLPMRKIRSVYASIFPEAHGYSKEWNQAAYLGTNPDDRQSPFREIKLQRVDGDEQLLQQQVDERPLPKPSLPKFLHTFEFAISEAAMDGIVEIARQKKVPLYFLYLPTYHGREKPSDREWLMKRAPILEASFLQSDPKNYADYAHPSEIGSERVTQWLADELNKILSALAEK